MELQRCTVYLLVAAGALAAAMEASGQEFTATGDVWLREVGPDSTFENDWVSVWSSASNDGGANGRRYGLYEWDISSLAGQDLASAVISLWVGDDYSGTTLPVRQHAFVLDTTGKTSIFSSTWNTVQNEHLLLNAETALESLGAYDQGVPLDLGITGTYQDSFAASANDLALLESIANGSGILTVLMVADEDGSDYRGDWGDGANAGGSGFGPDTPGKLIVTVVPEPAAMTLFGLAAAAVMTRKRR